MNHREILLAAGATLRDRAGLYGSEEDLFERACTMYSIMTGSTLTPFEAASFMVCLKLSRVRSDKKLGDNYIDALNYLAFAGQFAEANNPIPVGVGVRMKTTEDVTQAMEEDIQRMAQNLRPNQG